MMALHVTHQLAVKSTSTGFPAARACATAAGDQGCQSIPPEETARLVASVSAKLKEMNAVALLADYTRTPANITDEISKYGGAGVPLVLIYPKNSDAGPTVLPQPSPLQLPASYSKIIWDALNQAAK